MATSQQGKKKKKVLSQQQIDKLLGMLREEDKPLRAGILAKTLGYQSAKDINPTLLRLEGYGMVSRITMNNTPLWKYVSREGIAAMTSTSPRVEDDLLKEEVVDMARMHILAGPRLPHENCTIHQVIDVPEDSCHSRPQSTKADLEWDPSDIQAHREEEGGLHMGDADTSDYHTMTTYSNNGTSSFTSPNLAISLSHTTKGPMNTTLVHLADTAAGLGGANGVGDTAVLCFSANQGYAAQDIYSAIDSQREQLTVHTTAMNGLSGKMSATTNGQSFVGQDYVGMSAYDSTGDVHLNGGTNLNSAMQDNYNVEYGHQSTPQSESGSRGGVNDSDMYMSNGSVQHHMSNDIGGNNSIQANHQNFLLNSGNQVHSDYAHSNNNYTSSMPPSTPPHKSTATSNMQQQNYSRGDNHHHNHFNQNSYNTSSSSLGRMPTYVVQEIIKPEAVGQYGMTAPQGAPDGCQVSGYQSLHTHPHQHELDAGAMPPYSGQPFHTIAGLNNGGTSTQHHHPHHQQHLPHSQQHQQTHHQQQQPLTQAANFVNVGNFAGATYNQFQGTYGLRSPGRPYSGQHQGTGYSSAGLGPSKDLANYSGNNGAAVYHGSQLNKRHHFNGYTGACMFTNHLRSPIYPPGKMGHVRSTPVQKQSGFSRSHHTERQKGGHPHGRARFGLQGHGGPRTAVAHNQCEDGKVKHASIYTTDKEATRMEANKYMGTEVLDDICRRLANQASVQKKNASSHQQVEEPDKDTEEANTVQKDDDNKEKKQDKNSEKSKSDSVNDTAKIFSNSKKDIDSNKNPCSTIDEVMLTNGKDHSSSLRAQNSNRGYGGKQYPVRGGYHGRDVSRYHQHHRNSSRNCNGRTKGPTECVSNGKLANQNEPYKNFSESAANEKAGESKEKDATKGLENIKAVEVKYSTLETSSEQVQDDRPMAKYRALLLDHLDPNNVLLSHLFVRGLIDRVLVDQVRRMKTRRDAMEVLLPALLTIPQDAINTGFCDTLQKSGQVYLAELIKAAGLAGQCMSEQHAAYLKLHQQNIAASMIPDKELLSYLRTDSVLTHDLHRFVSTQPSRAQQIDTLLQVLPFRGDKAFETFRTALRRSGQPWLAEQIAMELT